MSTVEWQQLVLALVVEWKEVVWRDSNDTTEFPSAIALMWRDTSNAKPLRYITFNGKYLVVKNV